MLSLESREDTGNFNDSLPYTQLFEVKMFDYHYRDIIRILTIGYVPEGINKTQKKQLVVKATYFQLIVGQLYKMGPDEILHRYVLEHERPMVLNEAHVGVVGGHYVGKKQCARYYKQDCGGLLCMQTLEIIVVDVISSKELENHRDRMRCR